MRCINTLKHKETIAVQEILFSFCTENKQYVVLCPSSKNSERCECIEVNWNAWKGFSHIRNIVSEDILGIGNAIILWHNNNKKKYPLKGETYRVSCDFSVGESRVRIQKKENYCLQNLKKNLPTIFRFMIAIVWVILETKFCIAHAIQWLSVYIPTYTTQVLSMTIWFVEIIGASILFVLFSENRGPVATYINALIPIGTVIMLGVAKNYIWVRIVTPVIIATAVLVAYFALYRRDTSIGRGKQLMKAFRFALAVVTIACFLSTAIAGTSPFINKANEGEVMEQTEEQFEKKYQTACRKLYKQDWMNYSAQEKLDILQQICDYEAIVNLGCERVTLYSGRTDRASVLGTYNDLSRSILLNQTHLENDDIELVLDTVLHEVRHSFQHRMIDMYQSIEGHIEEQYKNMQIFREIQGFRDNFSDYCSGAENYDEYYGQLVEEDSRSWAEKRIKESYIYYIYPDR